MQSEKKISFMERGFTVSNSSPLVLCAGPCVIEDEKTTLFIAEELKRMAAESGIPFIFKASYDKANRSSIKSFRGPGLKEGLRILSSVKRKLGVVILTDVHGKDEVKPASEVADIIQIPAFLCRQTDLITACAKTGRTVNVKKGQFMSPWEMENVVRQAESCDNRKIILTERGTSFGYNNLIVDMRSIEVMKETGYPVFFDATHSVQLPGARGTSTGGLREFIRPLSTAAVSLGIAGIYVEVHPNPQKALSDGPNSLSLKEMKGFLNAIAEIDGFVKSLRKKSKRGKRR